MSTKSRLYLYIIGGGYVAYTGFDLLKNAIMNKPGNYLLFALIGGLFLLAGGFLVLKSLSQIMKGNYEDPMRDDLEETDETDKTDE